MEPVPVVYPWKYRPVGLKIVDAGPIRRAYLPLGDGSGLHLLYGRNGAGKSTVLRALRRPSVEGALVVRTPPGGVWRSEQFEIAEYVQRIVEAKLAHEDAAALGSDLAERLGAEFSRADHFLVDGQSCQPLLLPTEDTPALNSLAARMRERHRAVLAAWPDRELDHDQMRGYEDEILDFENKQPVGDLWQTPGNLPDETFPLMQPPGVPGFVPLRTYEYSPWRLDLGGVPADLRELFVGESVEGVAVETARTWALVCDRFPRSAPADPDLWTSQSFVDWCVELEAAANEIFGRLLLDAPQLHLERTSPAAWATKAPVRWRVGRRRLALALLSPAEQRWCAIAIRVALRQQLREALVLILDEPEAGLHRAAERHMGRGLAALASREFALVVAATHSPALLDLDSAEIHQVDKHVDGTSSVVRLDDVNRRRMRGLGLLPSDLLQLQRTFLLVEGTHDELVLRGLLGQELDRARVQIIPLRGGRNGAHVVDSNFLFDFTDARVVFLLDNLDGPAVDESYRRALATAMTASPTEAARQFREEYRGNAKAENVYLREFVSKVLLTDEKWDRCRVFGLTQEDVVLYLPVESFAPKARSWTEVLDRRDAHDPTEPIKKFMARTYGSRFDDADITAAVARTDDVPKEFFDLLAACG